MLSSFSNFYSVIRLVRVEFLLTCAMCFCAVGSTWVGLYKTPDGTGSHKWVDGSAFGGVGNAPTTGGNGCYRFNGNTGKNYHHVQCANKRDVICQHVCANKNKGK